MDRFGNMRNRKLVKNISTVSIKKIGPQGSTASIIAIEGDKIPSNIINPHIEGEQLSFVEHVYRKVGESEFLYKLKEYDSVNKRVVYEKVSTFGYSLAGNNIVEYKAGGTPTTIVGDQVSVEKKEKKPTNMKPSNYSEGDVEINDPVTKTEMKNKSTDDFKLEYQTEDSFKYKDIDVVFKLKETGTKGTKSAYVSKVNGKELEVGPKVEAVGSYDEPILLIQDITEYLNKRIGKEWLEELLKNNC